MKAVILDGGLLYLGNNPKRAFDIAEKNQGSVLVSQINLEKLSELLGFSEPKNSPSEELLSVAAQDLVKKLENLGISETIAVEFDEESKKVQVEAKFLGSRGMKAVGEGFVALGDLMKNLADDGEESLGETECPA
jgi:hypothetical protein